MTTHAITLSEAGLDHSLGRRTGTARRSVRILIRTTAVLLFSGCALLEIGLRVFFARSADRIRLRAEWLHRWSRFAGRVLGLHLRVSGKIPMSGLVVSNHLSYLDIIALSATRPMLFVAKADVARWPLFGWLARGAGTIFANRERKLSVHAPVNEISRAIHGGALVVLFAEGTSSDGATVLPFKSALLEPVPRLRCSITPAAIDYATNDGSVADEVCYWRDMTLVPHLLNLFGKESIEVKLRFGDSRIRLGNRKELAAALHADVSALRAT